MLPDFSCHREEGEAVAHKEAQAEVGQASGTAQKES